MISFHVIGLSFLDFVSFNSNFKSFISLEIMKFPQMTKYSVSYSLTFVITLAVIDCILVQGRPPIPRAECYFSCDWSYQVATSGSFME